MRLMTVTIRHFQSQIFTWWDTHKRDLPWRHTNNPYKILVSEVMLQQTQVSRVLPKYEEFLFFFSDVYALAHASPAKVLKVWKGMGYNRRALYLQRAAKTIVEKYHGEFPDNERELAKLPGVGTYTARAIMVFAFKAPVAMVDTNIRHIITHVFFGGKPQSEKVIQQTADKLVPPDLAWEWHQALMDYGSEHSAELKILKSKSKKQKIPFKQTNRFFRGRIVDLLREKEWKESRLIRQASETHKKSPTFIKNILAELARDGLIERSKTGIISLPE